jgi:hypothetical protein
MKKLWVLYYTSWYKNMQVQKKAIKNDECVQALSFNRALLVFNKRNTRNKNINIKSEKKTLKYIF